MADATGTSTSAQAASEPTGQATAASGGGDPASTNAAKPAQSEKTFTQADVDRIVAERLSRERKAAPAATPAPTTQAGVDNSQELASLKTQLSKAHVESAATMAAIGLGIDAKKIQHVIKLADFSAAEKDGTPDTDAITKALNKVLEDVPEFKPSANGSAAGFRVGAGEPGAKNDKEEENKIRRIMGLPPAK